MIGHILKDVVLFKTNCILFHMTMIVFILEFCYPSGFQLLMADLVKKRITLIKKKKNLAVTSVLLKQT